MGPAAQGRKSHPAGGSTSAEAPGTIEGVNPRTVSTAFRTVAVAEALSWIGLLAGMFVKYVPETSELGVQIFGPIHGAVFVAYVGIAVVASRVLRWTPATTVLALVASVPPLATVWFERRVTRAGTIPDGNALPAA
jgi:integral membrane protein